MSSAPHPANTSEEHETFEHMLTVIMIMFQDGDEQEAFDYAKDWLADHDKKLYTALEDVISEAFADIDDIDEVSAEKAKLNTIEAELSDGLKGVFNMKEDADGDSKL